MARIQNSFRINEVLEGCSAEDRPKLVEAALMAGYFSCYDPRHNLIPPPLHQVKCSGSDPQLGMIYDLTGHLTCKHARKFRKSEKLHALTAANRPLVWNHLLELWARQRAERQKARRNRLKQARVRRRESHASSP